MDISADLFSATILLNLSCLRGLAARSPVQVSLGNRLRLLCNRSSVSNFIPSGHRRVAGHVFSTVSTLLPAMISLVSLMQFRKQSCLHHLSLPPFKAGSTSPQMPLLQNSRRWQESKNLIAQRSCASSQGAALTLQLRSMKACLQDSTRRVQGSQQTPLLRQTGSSWHHRKFQLATE